MPGLNEFYRYIEKQEKTGALAETTEGAATTNGTEDSVDALASATEAKTAKSKRGVTTANGAGNVRYVLRNGITVAVPSEKNPVPVDIAAEEAEGTESVDEADPLNGIGGPGGTTLEDTLAMWQRLPRHIRLLASIEVPDREEVAQKYYTRGFRETRQALVERLLNPTLTLEETARVLGVCPATVRRYTNRGVLPHHRTVGQQRRFRLSDVLIFLEQQQQGGRGARVKGKDED